MGGEDSLEKDNGNPLQYSCLEKSMDRRAWGSYSPGDCIELDMTEWPTISVIKKLPANVGDTGLIPVPETKTHMLQGT